ncbi:MAG: NUDIX hydrolase [bacterium]
MANSELYNKSYRIPSEVLNRINSVLVSNPHGEGVKRAKNMLKNGSITYQAMKRLKNFFDYYNPKKDKLQYELAGGDLMKSFVDRTLNAERDATNRGDDIKRDLNVDVNLGTRASQSPRLNEIAKKKKVEKNATAIIVGKDNRFLLLKRSSYPEQWMPNKWSLVGGAVEKGENPETACKREILEECGLEIADMIDTFTIKRDGVMEYVFACRFNGDPIDVELNKEHDGYGWFTYPEIDYLDTVPHLKEFLILVFKKYD